MYSLCFQSQLLSKLHDQSLRKGQQTTYYYLEFVPTKPNLRLDIST